MGRQSAKNSAGAFLPFAIENVPWNEAFHGDRFGMRYQQLGEFGGCSKVGVCLEELAPGRQACPAHYHLLEEEHLMILTGSLTLRLGTQRYPMKAGDYVCFPAGQEVGHALLNEGAEICRYLIIGERDTHDVVVYTDSGRVSVRLTGEGYRKPETMDYWEGEQES